MLRRIGPISAGIFLILTVQLPVSAQTPDGYFRSAREALEQRQYVQALNAIEKAIALSPEELEYKYLKGLILIPLKRYDEAVDILKALTIINEERYAKAYFDLEGIYRLQGKYDDALWAMGKAENTDRERAFLHQGFIYLSSERYDMALARFKQILDSPLFGQEALYNSALAFYRKMDYKQALMFSQEAVERDPGTPAASFAQSLMETVKREMDVRQRVWLVLASSVQYDGNVILQPLEQAGLQKIGIPPSDKSDTAGVFSLRLGYKPIMNRNWDLALEATALQSVYTQLTDNNLTALMPGLRLDYSAHPLFFRMAYDFGHFMVAGESYADVHSVTPMLYLVEHPRTRSELLFRYDSRSYRDGLTPDASHLTFSLRQFLKVARFSEISLGGRYGKEDNKQDRGDFSSRELILGWTSPFLFESYLSVFYIYTNRVFEFTEIISPDQKRHDREHAFSVMINRKFGRHLELMINVHHIDNDSNIEFDIPAVGLFDPYNWRKSVGTLTLIISL